MEKLFNISDNPKHSGIKRKFKRLRLIVDDEHEEVRLEGIRVHYLDDNGNYGEPVNNRFNIRDTADTILASKKTLADKTTFNTLAYAILDDNSQILVSKLTGSENIVSYIDVEGNIISVENMISEWDLLKGLTIGEQKQIFGLTDSSTEQEELDAKASYYINKMDKIKRFDI